LCLAEALFAQERFEEAERLCLDVQSRPDLLKFERLRLLITLAKICHVNSRYEDAFSHWSEAMKAIGEFRMTNGRTTRVIVMSICDALPRLGRHTSLVHHSRKEVATLDNLARPGGIQYWIAGLQDWSEYLQSLVTFRDRDGEDEEEVDTPRPSVPTDPAPARRLARWSGEEDALLVVGIRKLLDAMRVHFLSSGPVGWERF
jgi:hypothetical protein